MADDDEKKIDAGSTLSTGAKIGLGVAAVMLVGGGFLWWRQKREEKAELAAAAAKPQPQPIEPIYSVAPAVVTRGSLPMLSIHLPPETPDTYWVYGDQSAAAVATALEQTLEPTIGAAQAYAPVAVPVADPNLMYALSQRIALKGMAGFPGGADDQGQPTPAVGLWVVVLGPSQVGEVSVPLAKEYLKNLRMGLGSQRVLWLLARSVHPSVAKALAESGEEFVRSNSDEPSRMAIYAANAAAAPNLQELARAFPPPKTTT